MQQSKSKECLLVLRFSVFFSGGAIVRLCETEKPESANNTNSHQRNFYETDVDETDVDEFGFITHWID